MKKPKLEIYVATGEMDRLFRQILKMWRAQMDLPRNCNSLWKWVEENKNHFGYFFVLEWMLNSKFKKLTYLKHHRFQSREICFFGTIEECEAHLQKMFDELKRKEKLQSFK